MTASISDILTTMKNIVVALSNISTNVQSLYNNVPTSSLFSGAASTSASVLYTAGTGSSSHLNTINICNTATSSATFSLYIVPSGGSASASNAIFYNCPIPANTTTLWTGTLVIPASGTLQGNASAATVTFSIAGGSAV
jgi:hypothetical protein